MWRAGKERNEQFKKHHHYWLFSIFRIESLDSIKIEWFSLHEYWAPTYRIIRFMFISEAITIFLFMGPHNDSHKFQTRWSYVYGIERRTLIPRTNVFVTGWSRRPMHSQAPPLRASAPRGYAFMHVHSIYFECLHDSGN